MRVKRTVVATSTPVKMRSLGVMSLTGVAQQTLEIVDRGSYIAPSGKTVDVRASIDAALRGTVLYRPAERAALALPPERRRDTGRPRIEGVWGGGSWGSGREATAAGDPQRSPPISIEVTPETTAAASRRLVQGEGEARVLA